MKTPSLSLLKNTLNFIWSFYYCFRDSATPTKEKKIVIASLIYFVIPFDFIPDFLFPIGYADDIGLLIISLIKVSKYITNEHRSKAFKVLSQYF